MLVRTHLPFTPLTPHHTTPHHTTPKPNNLSNTYQINQNQLTPTLGFLSSTWHVRSSGAFAASCIGVILLVITLELLRRLGKEYDISLQQSFHRAAAARYASSSTNSSSTSNACGEPCNPPTYPSVQRYATYRPSPLQQAIRAVIHSATFAVAYFVMLLAMYFNGYIIICIFIGAALGKFLCDWTSIRIPVGGVSGSSVGEGKGAVKAGEEELTYCCG